MKKYLRVSALMLLATLACVVPAFGQVGLAQSFTMTVAAGPPTVLVGQAASSTAATGASVSATGGTIAAGSYRICVTFFSLANTESPCSTDTAASSVAVLTGSTSSLTVQAPVPAAGIGSIVGYRVYVGASGGASGAEALVTPAATICTLSASSTPSCSLNSPAVFTNQTFSSGSGGPATPGTLLTYPTSNAANMTLFENSLYSTRILNWVLTGTAPSACTVQLQTGAAPGSLSNVGQSLTCTATGSYALPITARAAYVAPNITAFTAGDLTTSMTFTIVSLPYIQANYWGPVAPTSACVAGTGFFTAMSTTTSTIYTCVSGTWTAVTLP